MSNRIGLISENNCPSDFDSFKGYFVNPDNPNYPKDLNSPNYPRKEGRISGYQNPLLGDPGWGEIARWQKVKTNALETLVDQMIEQYTRDRRWYSDVRCRESLWNMYRRLEWWVNQNVEPGSNDYQNALSFIRDCIVQILDTGEKPKIISQHRFKGGLDGSFTYKGGWDIDEYGYLSGSYIFGETVIVEDEEYEVWTISKPVVYPSDGLITFNYALQGYVETFALEVDGEVIWEHDSAELVNDVGFTFRDITLPIPEGTHEFKWVLVGEIGGSLVKIDEIVFTELYPKIEKPEDIPKCPLPYNHHFASDYTNYFTGVPYERPTFSTVGGSKVSDYLDMIRYVSSKENIEWVQVKRGIDSNWDETIFKLPLERLPETLSSKMTFNWRLKRKGYITFKYWIDGGNGSELLFYINNQLVGGPWKDTDGWQEVRFNMSQSQTYKFDFLAHKSVSKDLGTNAVYIKDIEVVEVTDYTDEPMPGDYFYEGEEAEAEYGKWLIYSNRGVLGSYYRGFPDGAEDTVRELELEFYSECDGVFSFAHRLGTEDPDRLVVEGLIFKEQYILDESPIIWDGSENGVGFPTITVTPKYSTWKNTIPDGYSDIQESMIWTKDSDSLVYNVKIDGDWDGFKYLDAYGKMRVVCPPRYVVETDFLEAEESGEWIELTGGWGAGANIAVYTDHEMVGRYGYAIYRPHEDSSIISMEIDGVLRNRDVLNVYVDGRLYRRLYQEFDNLVMNIPNFGGDIKVEVAERPDDGRKELVFSGIVEFDGEFKPIEKETMYGDASTILDATYMREDERGRRISAWIPTGSLETSTAWYTDTGVIFNISMLPEDEVVIKIPNNKITFVDYARLEAMLEEYKEGLEITDPIQTFYEDFNPFVHTDRVKYNSNIWEIVDIFEFLNIPNRGDSVIAHEAVGGPRTVQFEINLEGIELLEGGNYLSFEYGALFHGGDYAEIYARTDDGDQLLRVLTSSILNQNGYLVRGVEIPPNTKSLIFSYTYGGGGSE